MKKLIILLFVGVLTTQFNASAQLMAGTAKVNITPPTKEPIHDSVYARILRLESRGLRLTFVSADLALFTSERIAKICKEKSGLTQVWLCSSHNHSAAQPDGKRSCQD